jgi:hypothetical protein
MKNICARIGLIGLAGLMALAVGGCRTRGELSSTVQNRLTNVVLAKERAGLDSARIVIDEGQIASVGLHSGPYLRAVKKIDVSGCPENFRAAWSDYLAAWERKRKQEQARPDTIDGISMWKGNYADLPATVRCLEAYDTKEAWENCERIAAGWGVNAANLNLP